MMTTSRGNNSTAVGFEVHTAAVIKNSIFLGYKHGVISQKTEPSVVQLFTSREEHRHPLTTVYMGTCGSLVG
jgi:hypothetical protein